MKLSAIREDRTTPNVAVKKSFEGILISGFVGRQKPSLNDIYQCLVLLFYIYVKYVWQGINDSLERYLCSIKDKIRR